MNKIKIMDQVFVYQDLFSEDELDILLDEINKSENSIDGLPLVDLSGDAAVYDEHGLQPEDKKDGSLIFTWKPWYTFGKRSIWSHPTKKSNNDRQILGYSILNNALLKAKEDYLINHSSTGFWNYPINWFNKPSSKSVKHSLFLSQFEILKHKKNLDSKYTIDVHIDLQNQREEEPGPKQILTFTIYLNDDYEGGEVDFVDERNNHLIVYKPKKGDITVFPSDRPYWHGARAVTSDTSKIFIRSFLSYIYPGSKRWMEGLYSYGLRRWNEIENERIKDFIKEGNASRQIVFKEEEIVESKNSKPLFINQETYIDGRLKK